MKTLATYSIKGGVGKTTSAVNLAYEAARSGARVVLWDLDPQGAATYFFRVKAVVKGGAERLIGSKGSLDAHIHATDFAGLHIVPADFSLRHLDLQLDDTKRPTRRLAALLEPLADRYDVAILDCPPGITLASEGVFAAADALLVPTIPTTLSKRTLDQLCEFLADHPGGPAILPFASMVDRRKKLQRDLVDRLAEETPGFLPTVIPNASVIEQMGIERSPVGVYAPASPSAEAFRQLWADIAAQLWK
ncbi:MAG: ParA family protein [Actinomycetota bacterium]|nr:ParA family protein [Actinomycetota bacterium]